MIGILCTSSSHKMHKKLKRDFQEASLPGTFVPRVAINPLFPWFFTPNS